jgi:hypothetical protein
MPILTPGIKYTELRIKPPVTLRAIIPKDNLVGAKGKLGSTVDTITVDNVRYGISVYVCKEGEPDCATAIKALTVEFRSDRANNRWLLVVTFESFYVAIPTSLQFEVYRFGSEVDTYIDVTFRDAYVSVVVNGKEYLATDTFKRFEQIREIESVSAYLDPAGAPIDPAKISDYLAFNLQLMQVADISGIVNVIIPIAITIAVIGAVLTVVFTIN